MSGTEAIAMLLIVAGQILVLLLVIPIAEAIEDWRSGREKATGPEPEPKFNLSVLKEKHMRRPPLNMGDAFVVDDGDLGITVKAKGKRPFREIMAMWPDERKKKFAYKNFETLTFFNGLGTTALLGWLEAQDARHLGEENE